MLKNNEIIENFNEYSLLTMPIRLEDQLRIISTDDGFRDFLKLGSYLILGKYLGLNKYICTAIDNDVDRSEIMLVLESDGTVIEKIC